MVLIAPESVDYSSVFAFMVAYAIVGKGLGQNINFGEKYYYNA